MSETESDLQNPSQANDSTEKFEELRRIVNLLFAGLIISSFTLTAYLGLEARRAAVLAAATKAEAEQVDRELKQADANVEPAVSKLVEFGHTHPDFQAKVLSKYQISTNGSAGAKK